MSKNFLPTTPYKGTRDFYPDEMRLRTWFFEKMRAVAESYGYEEYGGPIVESFELYAAKSGEELVNEQIYHFTDKGDRRLAIRPEMTPSVARMVAGRLEQLVFPLRWYSIPNVMRYERPQKGRLREHWQLNMDIFGEPGQCADLEIMRVIVDLMLAFGADPSMFKIRISNRRLFNDVLRALFQATDDNIHVISKAVDKRAKISPEEYEKWLAESGISHQQAVLLDEIFKAPLEDVCGRLGENSQGAQEIRELFALIKGAGLGSFCEFDFSVVRGFDYYTGTVFEVYDTSPENRRTLFGGGRYDDLVGLFKKAQVPGIGFGFGDVTFQSFLEIHNLLPANLHVMRKALVCTFEDVPYAEYVKISSELRAAGIANSIYLDPSAKMKKQLAFAEKQEYPIVIVLGTQELESGAIVLKQMARREQVTVPRGECIAKIREWFDER